MEYYVVNNTPTVGVTSTISFTGLFNILRNIFLNQTTFLNSAWVLILLPHVTARPWHLQWLVFFCLMRFFPISNIPPTVLNSILQSLISTGRTIEPLS